MSVVNKPYTFSANTNISSSQMNANFDTIYNDYNGGISATNLANNAVTTAKITDDAVTADKIANNTITVSQMATAMGAGSGGAGAWDSFTPSWTNITVGSGTNSGKYMQIGKTVFVETKFIFGAGSAVSGSPILTLPVTASGFYTAGTGSLGVVDILDSGTINFAGVVRYASTTTVTMQALNAAAAAGLSHLNVSSTVPMTWATNDQLTSTFMYEAA